MSVNFSFENLFTGNRSIPGAEGEAGKGCGDSCEVRPDNQEKRIPSLLMAPLLIGRVF